MKIEIHSKPIEEDFIVLERGHRSYLHPKLKLIEQIDCKITYSQYEKFFIVDYKRIDNKFTKTLLTQSIDEIVNILLEKDG